MFYLAEIKWETDQEGQGPRYECPGMVFDARSVADCGVPNLTAGKFVLCEGAVTPVGAVALGELGHALTLGERQSVRSVLGWTPSGTVEDFIYQLVGPESDVTGLARCKPVRVGRNQRLAFKVGSLEYSRRVNLADSDWQRTLAIERGDYAVWRAEAQAAAQALAAAGRTWEQVLEHKLDHALDPLDVNLLRLGAPDKHLRCLDYLREKYVAGRAQDEVAAFLAGVRGALPDEGLLPHRTTVTETWTCADSASLNCDQTHTEVQGNLDIAGNEATNTLSETVCARMEADVSSADHYAESSCAVTVSTTPVVWVGARYSASAHTHYAGGHRPNTTFTYNIDKVVTGTKTTLGFLDTTSPGSGYILDRMECNGSTQKMYSAGVERVSLTDTAITAGTRAGVHSNPNGSTRAHYAGLEITDLAAATFDLDRIERRTMRGVMRGVGRGT